MEPWFQPGKWLTKLLALAALLLVVMFLLDQLRLIWSDDYRAARKERRTQMCFHHVELGAASFAGRKLSELQGADLRRYRAALQREHVRQHSLPVDLWGKVDLFFLCASIRSVKFAGVEIDGASNALVQLDEAETRQAVLAEASQFVEGLTLEQIGLADDDGQVREVQKAIARALGAEVSEQQEKVTVLTKEVRPVEIEPAGETPVWLLIVGADQEDAAAVNQVRQTKALLQKALAGGVIDSVAPVELRLIRSWKRTVILYDSQAAADAAFKALKDVLPYGGYIRAQSAWCADLAEADPIEGVPTMRCEL